MTDENRQDAATDAPASDAPAADAPANDAPASDTAAEAPEDPGQGPSSAGAEQ